ncbi:30S ribosomal protein S9 [Ignisphaera sp. 4213-co]|uniref:Small ribosomal subunit protein uS9 n=1 Tax=Ignisphaera cupida TaxID=3050454 RepID=A0ABD4Z8Z3_9CREN|nr:30S ribosomal protein S9 [Ignisphaera sp. 4213-co]MDK6028553.1 30S ribosomal protein S9 [Ignisphaera sp. 4213-co]
MSQEKQEINVLGAYPQLVAGKKIVLSVGKRKTAIARAVIRPGQGRFKVNGVPVELWPIELAKLKMMEPLNLLSESLRNAVDIDVQVEGGGVMAQAYAVRTAVARGLVIYFENPVIKKLFSEYDRSMLAGDPRQTESEKWMRYSARRFRQKSYR